MRNKKNHFLNKLTSKLNKAVMSVMAVALVVSALLLTGFDTVNTYRADNYLNNHYQGIYTYNGVKYVRGDIFFIMDDNYNADTSRIMSYDERKAVGNLIDPETDKACIYIDGRYYDAKDLQNLRDTYAVQYGGSTPAVLQIVLSQCPYKTSLAGVPKPVVTETPVVTEALAAVEEPVQTVTEAPVATEAPTETPVVTEAPTATPEPTVEPEVTEAQEPTEVPTETPEPTEAPVVTETPEPTEAPVVTETPEPTEEPEVT